ncbi:PASTA domain-containing protein [Paenibacillus glucanolyticus]|jgi:penicillin-binding protein 2B|uniref:penicillin-binding transpeptidase domain-containing protein n=1 Tax=Paenibacillus TaxID=44249 RepID=UPI0003E21A66|nr:MULTISPECIES: penicillin-binding transpeptidase domain-containing protein [Paenibacillus]ANA81676.1 stage V sporulation protein D [Paenibacillus glucanolyticus]AVV59590.1 PASTA domain-containing protein [Paenibacillus glucanolyticus]ETT42110.1 peptidoglycan glycosyltransferase [Paenibacillus sp. FSL R5-808]OMF68656.1 stage V sporulation protein D [Paenibacillus glucanolyticus]
MIKKIKLRTVLIGGCITLFFALLIGRVFWLQVIDNDFWKEQAVSKWSRKQDLPATRGTIMDRDGDIMAMDAPAFTVVLNPAVIQANGLENEVVKGLHEILGKDEDELRKLVKAKNEKGEYLQGREVRNEGWKIDQEKMEEVKEFSDGLNQKLKAAGKVADSGIGFQRESKRYYPQKTLAAHILGYTERQGKAVGGIEQYYDEDLKGTDGFAAYKSDKKGIKLPSEDELYQPAINGKNLVLTMDDTIQYYIEEAMRETYNQYKPISMTVIAADPNTMEILGMANMPTFDPNTYSEWNQKNFNNHAVRSRYEPGSTFKIVTLASAVQEKLFNPGAIYQSGSIRAGGRTHRDINSVGWGPITYLEGVKKSSNVAFVKLGYEMLGKERFTNYIRDFGFTEKTNIDLPHEVLGTLNMTYDSDISTMTYGYAVSVTPIQQIAAISAVANGGKLMVPHMVKEIEDPNTGKVQKIEPEVVRQVITPEAARETGKYLEQVVADQDIGTGWRAYIDGYRVAGKTGTAIKSSDGYKDRSKQVVSFIGYAPVENPKIAVLVIIDEPNVEKGGGALAAPIFKEIVSKTLTYWGVPKSNSTPDKEKSNPGTAPKDFPEAPDFTGMKLSEAKAKLLEDGVAFETLGNGSTVKEQYPPPKATISAGQRIYLLTEDSPTMEIPNLEGESLRDAMEVLTLMKVKVNVQGEGYVASQLEAKENGQRIVQLTLKSAEELLTGTDTPEDEAEPPADNEAGATGEGETEGKADGE